MTEIKKVISMSKLYLYSKTKSREYATKVLELSSASAAKEAVRAIKRDFPTVNVTVYGAKDFSALRRTQRDLNISGVVKTIPEFIDSFEEHNRKYTRV
jgi:hypothetical protein